MAPELSCCGPGADALSLKATSMRECHLHLHKPGLRAWGLQLTTHGITVVVCWLSAGGAPGVATAQQASTNGVKYVRYCCDTLAISEGSSGISIQSHDQPVYRAVHGTGKQGHAVFRGSGSLSKAQVAVCGNISQPCFSLWPPSMVHYQHPCDYLGIMVCTIQH